MEDISHPRAFKTAWFTKAARKAKIGEDALCKAIQHALLGQADDLGGGVYKKRLENNNYRSIILAKGGDFWIYSYLFAKKDRKNIDDAELSAFRDLAKIYATMDGKQVDVQITDRHWIEIYKDKREPTS